jgi:hypothetical protein
LTAQAEAVKPSTEQQQQVQVLEHLLLSGFTMLDACAAAQLEPVGTPMTSM